MLVIGDYLQNRYRVVSHLGRGGMGSVFEAWDERFDISVALKEISVDLSQIPDAKQHGMVGLAFEREAKTLAKLHHEAFPHVIDYFSERGKQYLVMELVQGQDLAARLYSHQGPFGLEEVLNWTYQLLEALDYLHTQEPPIVHRDLKPQNLKLTTRGKIKLLDFGIAKGVDAKTGHTTITNQTFVAATLNYSPIEQLLRVLDPTFREVIVQRYESKIGDLLNQQADARSDLYSLGATLYHFLTGAVPADALKRLLDVWNGKPDPLTPPAQINRQIPEEISAFLIKTLEIERENRFSSADEMRLHLQQAVADWQKRFAQEEADRAGREEEERQERDRREAAEREKIRLEAERQEKERLRLIEEERERQAAEIERRRREAEYRERLRVEAEQKRQAELSARQRRETDMLPALHAPRQHEPIAAGQNGVAPSNESDANPFATTSQLSTAYTKTSFLKGLLPEEPVNESSSSSSAAKAATVETYDNSKPKIENTGGYLPLSSMLENSGAATAANRRRPFWILPVAALLFLLFGGALLGMWLRREPNNAGSPPAANVNQSVQSDSRDSSLPTPALTPAAITADIPAATTPMPSAPASDITSGGSTTIVSATPDSASAPPRTVSDKTVKSARNAPQRAANPSKTVRPTVKPTKAPVTLDDLLKDN